jgi:hypothetical protein
MICQFGKHCKKASIETRAIGDRPARVLNLTVVVVSPVMVAVVHAASHSKLAVSSGFCGLPGFVSKSPKQFNV